VPGPRGRSHRVRSVLRELRRRCPAPVRDTLREPDWAFDESELAQAFGSSTRAIVINDPGNPTGKVFSRATIPGMENRTITISALSKTYAVTGWRVGWAIAPPRLTGAIRRVHDFLTVGAPTPLQEAGAVALRLPGHYYTQLAAGYAERRDLMLAILARSGLPPVSPVSGAYYVMTDISALGLGDDTTAAAALVRTAGVAAVPGSSFYSRPRLGRTRLRFSFSKKLQTLREAGRRLSRLRA